jgi:hypothetical protein
VARTTTVYNPLLVFDIGSSLREARTRQGLDFPELEELTKIRPKYLRALEDENFDILPAPTYVRGFLRTYASALGLDGQPFVDEYNSRFAVGEEEAAPLRARRAPQARSSRTTRESRMAVLAIAGIAIVMALVIAAWRFGAQEAEKVPGLAVDGQETTAPTKSRGRVVLVIRAARGSSRMEVRAGSPSGRLLYSGTLEQGQAKRFDGRRLQLVLARPGNVVVRRNGKAVDLPAGTTFVVTSRQIAPASSS